MNDLFNKFLREIQNKDAKANVRLLNYLFAVIVIFSFWVVGQVTNNPNGAAWGNILKIAYLPIWTTMGSNNTNCNSSSCQADGFDTWEDVFKITCYNVPLETDFTKSKITKVVVTNPNTCATTTEGFRSDFLSAVNLNGTGKDDDGQLISIEWFCGSADYRYVSCPTGSCGLCLSAGSSFAISGNRFVCSSPVCIEGYGQRTREDSGGGLGSLQIDLFQGFGKAVCANWPNADRCVWSE